MFSKRPRGCDRRLRKVARSSSAINRTKSLPSALGRLDPQTDPNLSFELKLDAEGDQRLLDVSQRAVMRNGGSALEIRNGSFSYLSSGGHFLLRKA